MSLEAFIEAKPRRFNDWLIKKYPNKGTRRDSRDTLRNWIKCFYGENSVTNYMRSNLGKDRETVKRNVEARINEIEEGLERYFSELEDRDFTDDYETFLRWARNEGYANLTIRKMSNKVKFFFARQDPRCKIDDDNWDDIKKTLIPKSKRAATQDDILTKEQLKKVLQHLPLHAKALALFLLSTGARVGAACQLKMSDINLDSDPPEVNIREKYTKGEVGGRVMWFSYEARDAIIEWHKTRLFKKKPGRARAPYDMNLVFNFKKHCFKQVWNRALLRADGKRVPPVLAKRDPSTKVRIHVYHVHTLRKFFSTKMNLAGVPSNTVHAWMGHQAYLAAAYDRQEYGDLSLIYKNHMNVVTVYELTLEEEAKKLIEEAKKKAKELSDKNVSMGTLVNYLGEELGVTGDMDDLEKMKEIITRTILLKMGKLEIKKDS